MDVVESSVSGRREFCARACQAAALAALGVVLPGCGGSTSGPSGVGAPTLPNLSASIAGGAFTLTIDATSPLSTVGKAALVNASGRTFLVARTTDASFTAV